LEPLIKRPSQSLSMQTNSMVQVFWICYEWFTLVFLLDWVMQSFVVCIHVLIISCRWDVFCAHMLLDYAPCCSLLMLILVVSMYFVPKTLVGCYMWFIRRLTAMFMFELVAMWCWSKISFNCFKDYKHI